MRLIEPQCRPARCVGSTAPPVGWSRSLRAPRWRAARRTGWDVHSPAWNHLPSRCPQHVKQRATSVAVLGVTGGGRHAGCRIERVELPDSSVRRNRVCPRRGCVPIRGCCVSVASGTIAGVPRNAVVEEPSLVLVSHTGVPLSRSTTFRFTLDPNREQHQRLLAHAGAARLAYNHHIGRAVANLGQRSAERSYGVAEADLTPPLSWSKVSFINHMNAWKDGRSADTRVSLDAGGNEVRGLPWRGEVSTDVFECASVNAATALANWSKSRKGARAGKAAGFPRFKSRHKSPPAFRLRSKSKPGQTSPVRAAGPRALRLPKLGELRVCEHTGQFTKLLASGRFHVYAASFRLKHGRWVVAITGVAAQLHHLQRSPKNRHQARVGVDLGVKTLGVKTLAVVADEQGRVLHTWAGVKALQHAQARLKLANQSYSRTKRDSGGRKKAAVRLGKVHARVAHLRCDLLHGITAELARGYSSVTIEDLNVAGMLQLRSLARYVSDAAFGAFRAQLEYKAAWYGTKVVVADRWFPSSKTCSGCGAVNANLTLADRVYDCGHCGLVIDRDVNAAVNLARYTPPPPKASPLPAAA
jgi:putative transposase